MAPQNILIVGATGNQGGATLKALLNLPPNPTNPIHILALTRDAQSPRAQALVAAHPKTITLIQGDNTNPKPIFASQPKGSITGLFVVTANGTKVSEENQAIPLIDAAVAHGVKHIVFASVERGGEVTSWSTPTNVKSFLEKHHIELYLRDKAALAEKDGNSSNKFTWTILRPSGFMDNFNPGFNASMFTAMWTAGLSPTTRIPLISTRDIGVFAARALADPEAHAGRAISLAGDYMTLAEIKQVFERTVKPGQKFPQTFTFLGKALMCYIKELKVMFEFFETCEYEVDIAKVRAEVPEVLDFEQWLRVVSKWET
ncbi:hypothetical protein B0J18DRAFT_295537 [Chaetomium sp. MPI-SDFR-AT-0129]|nr:hypothetical protein B0J18DRAFT_295537 [Chaetomium sp. MPI-SDFR-AT-0129]